MYTKGDWKVEDGTNVVSGDRLVANTGGYSNNVHPARLENETNARLIAAAPDMYEALEWLLNDRDSLIAYSAGFKALAKAEGKDV